MITSFVISSVEGKIDSVDALNKQGFPKINVNLEEVKKDGDSLAVKYSFLAEYFDVETNSKKVGELKIAGSMQLKADGKESIDEIAKKWEEKQTLPQATAEEIINSLNFRCSATGTLIAYSLGLIPPLSVSQIKIKENPEKQ